MASSGDGVGTVGNGYLKTAARWIRQTRTREYDQGLHRAICGQRESGLVRADAIPCVLLGDCYYSDTLSSFYSIVLLEESRVVEELSGNASVLGTRKPDPISRTLTNLQFAKSNSKTNARESHQTLV